MTGNCSAGSMIFSSCNSPAVIVCKCSEASILNVARSAFRNASSAPFTVSNRVSFDQLLHALAEVVEIAGGVLELLGARDILRARLPNVLHRSGHLVHADELLLARRRDL